MVGGGTFERIKRMNRMRVRLGLFVMLVLLVGTGAAHARPSIDRGEKRVAAVTAEAGFLVRAWSWLTAMVGQGGSFIDPLGGLVPGTASPTSNGRDGLDGGSFIDPLGGK
jgi:hypothetical protein